MPNLSLRGLDGPTLSCIRSSARRRKVSVNRLIVDTLRQQYGAGGQTHDDLDALVGRWTPAEAAAFDAVTAPFSEVDTALWAAEPRATYRVRRAGKRRR